MDPRLERTYIMIKPDAVQRGYIGEVIHRFETKGYKLLAMKLITPTKELVENHYAEHKGKPFFEKIVKFILSGTVVCMVWQGLCVVKTGRKILGATNPENSNPRSIRGSICIETGRNGVHGSDSVESAEREIKIWFKDEEIVEYEKNYDKFLYEAPLPKKELEAIPMIHFAKVAQPAPNFRAKAWMNEDIKDICLKDYQDKWVILFFYPSAFKFSSLNDIYTFIDAYEDFKKLNCEILLISKDSVYVQRQFALTDRKEGGLAPVNVPMIADNTHEISNHYECLIKTGENKGENFNAFFIIDPKGVIRHMNINDPSASRNVDEIIRILKILQTQKEEKK